MVYTTLKQAVDRLVSTFETTDPVGTPDRANSWQECRFERDKKLLAEAQERYQAKKTDPNVARAELEVDPVRYQKILDQISLISWRIGYVRGLVDMDREMKAAGRAGVLTAKDHERLGRELVTLPKELEAFLYGAPTVPGDNKADRSTSVYTAAYAQAKIDIDLSCRKVSESHRFIDKEETFKTAVRSGLLMGLDNPMIAHDYSTATPKGSEKEVPSGKEIAEGMAKSKS